MRNAYNYLKQAFAFILILTFGLTYSYAQTGMGVGTNSPAEKLDVNGGVKIGNTTNTNAGTIRWTGTAFQGYDGTQWISFGGGANGWSLTGNTGTTPGTNFLGTSDNQALHLRTNNLDRMIITNTGNVGIGTTVPVGKLHLMDGVMRISASSGAPTIDFVDDADNSKMSINYQRSSDRLEIRDNSNNPQFVIRNANGFVGIGISTPGSRLHVDGSIRMVDGNQQAGYVPVSDANGIMTWTDPATITTADDGDWTVSGSNQYSAVSGSVGIGTTTPSYKLDVNGDIYTQGNYLIINTSGTGTNSPPFRIDGFADKLYVIAESNANGPATGTEIRFRTSATNIAASDRMIIDKNGNVGIATTGPTTKLHLIGDQRIENGTLTLWSNDAADKIQLTNGGTNGSKINHSSGWTVDYYAGPGNASVSGGHRFFTTENGYAERMRITNSGNIGIGITAPSAYLDITGLNNSGTTSLKLRSGNGGLASGSNQIVFGYNGNTIQQHAIKTRHHSGQDSRNAIDFFVWDYGTDANTDVGTKRVMSIDGADNGRVGIGVLEPAEELHVVGSMRMVDGNQAAGYIPVSDANGTMTWTDPTTITTGDDGDWTVSGNHIYNSNTGNVGIGTSTTTGKLHVELTNGSFHLWNNSGSGGEILLGGFTGNTGLAPQIRFDETGVGNFWDIGMNDDNYFTIERNGTDRILVDGSGNLGVGTVAPTAKLYVTDGTVLFDRRSDGSNTQNNLTIAGKLEGSVNPYVSIDFQNYDFNNAATDYIGASIRSHNNGGSDDGDLRFLTTSDQTLTEAMRIDHLGNVGIGTTNPNAKLTVGNGLTNNLTPMVTINSDGNQPVLVGENTNNKAVMIGYDGNDIQGRTGTNLATNGDLLLNRFNGNVGVGTTTPGQKLDVNGKIQMRTGATAGYVPVSDANGTMTWTNPTTIATADDGDWGTNGTHIYKANSGNVGIGTTNPESILNIQVSNNGINAPLVLRNYDNTSGGNAVGIGFINNAGGIGSKGMLVFERTGSWGEGAFHFLSNTDNNVNPATLTDSKMTIAANGNVGIGTTSTTGKLHVELASGSFRLWDNLGSGGEVALGGFSGNAGLAPKLRFTETGISDFWDIGMNDNNAFMIDKNGAEQVVVDLSGNIGIATTTPGQKLDVNGKIQMRTGATAGYVPVSDANGTMTWTDPTTITTGNDGDWTISGSNQYSAVTGNIGIGTSTPSEKLHIKEGDLRISRTSGAPGINFYDDTDNSYMSIVYQRSIDRIEIRKQDNTPGFVMRNNNGYVGIGLGPSGQPSERLHVVGNIRMVDGNQQAGYIPVSDANGVMTWTDPTTITTADDGDWTINGNDQYSAVSGNVGIGTTVPASVLNVYDPDESATQTNFTQAIGNAGLLITSQFTNGAYTPGVFWNTTNNSADKPKAGIYTHLSNSGSKLLFGTSNSFSAGINGNVMALDHNGKLGIGTDSPYTQLQVVSSSNSGIEWNGMLNNPNNSGDVGYGVGLRLQNSNPALANPNEQHKWVGVAARANGAYSNQTDMVFYTNNFASGANTTSAPTERMRLTGSTDGGGGNLGLGTTVPVAKLHVVAAGATDQVVARFAQSNTTNGNTTLVGLGTEGNGWSKGAIGFQRTGSYDVGDITFNLNTNSGGGTDVTESDEVMRITNTGRVGLGTTNPTQAKFVVIGSATYNNLNAHYYNSGGSHSTTTANRPLSAYFSNHIACSELQVFSDERIKNVKGLSDSKEDLATLMAIEITDYTFKDTVSKGNEVNKKVIAQQVEEVYPQAVSTITDVVPDIYQLAPISDGRVTIANGLKAGDRVKLILENREEIVDVLSADAEGFNVDITDNGQVFVYGREVADFHTVDYDALSTLNISATQELVKMINQLKAQNSSLEEKYNTLSSDVEALKVLLNMNTEAKR